MNVGKFQSTTRKMSVTEMSWLLVNAQVGDGEPEGHVLQRTLFLKKLNSAKAMNAVVSAMSSACGRRMSPQVSTCLLVEPPGIVGCADRRRRARLERCAAARPTR